MQSEVFDIFLYYLKLIISMKQKYYWIFGILAISAVIFISGCIQQGQKCPQCLDLSSWSKCNDQAIKTRINYKCSAETNYACQSYEETTNCKTEIVLKGNKGFVVVVSPTLDETVKGVIKVSVNSIPSEGTKIWAMLSPQGMGQVEDPFKEPNVIIQIVDARAGQSVFLDTTKVKNGVYNLGIMTTVNPKGGPWTDVVQTQLIIEN